jgi:hypothetical protein
VARGSGRLLQRVDGGLDRRGVRRQRAPVQFGYDHPDARGAQAVGHTGEVLGPVIQAVDQNHIGHLLRLGP